jgi:hypothetical protein
MQNVHLHPPGTHSPDPLTCLRHRCWQSWSSHGVFAGIMVDVQFSGSMLPSVDAFVTTSVKFQNEEKRGSQHDHDLLDGLLKKRNIY